MSESFSRLLVLRTSSIEYDGAAMRISSIEDDAAAVDALALEAIADSREHRASGTGAWLNEPYVLWEVLVNVRQQ